MYWIIKVPDGSEIRYSVGATKLGRVRVFYGDGCIMVIEEPSETIPPDDGLPYFTDDENGNRILHRPDLT